MRPPWPRLALRSLVRGGPAGPGCGLGWPRQECPGVAKPLIQLHLVAFGCISCRLRGAGMRRSREGRNDEDQCSSQRRYGVMGSCRWFGGWAYVGDGMAFGRFANRPYIQTGQDARFSLSRGPLEVPCPCPGHPHPMLRIDLSPMQGEVNTCLRGNDGVLSL